MNHDDQSTFELTGMIEWVQDFGTCADIPY